MGDFLKAMDLTFICPKESFVFVSPPPNLGKKDFFLIHLSWTEVPFNKIFMGARMGHWWRCLQIELGRAA